MERVDGDLELEGGEAGGDAGFKRRGLEGAEDFGAAEQADGLRAEGGAGDDNLDLERSLAVEKAATAKEHAAAAQALDGAKLPDIFALKAEENGNRRRKTSRAGIHSVKPPTNFET